MQCVACHKTISAGSWREAIEPRGGFVAEPRIEEVPMTRPDRIYHSQDSYIGDGKQIDEFTYIVNGKHILLKSSENDSINNKHYPLISNSQQIENGRRINLKNLEANNQGFHCLLISDISKRKLLHRIDYYIIERVTVNIVEGFVFDKKNININISQLSNNGIFLPIVDAVSMNRHRRK